MANTNKTAVALAPATGNREVAIDRTVVGAPAANQTTVVGEMMGALKNSLHDMDDINVEISAHSDQTRSSASVKFTAYRRGNVA